VLPAASVGPVAVVCAASGANTNVATPLPFGAADNVTVVPLTLTTRVFATTVPTDPGTVETTIPGYTTVPAGTVKVVVPVLNTCPGNT
jgi:hypothetical protein